MTMSASASLLGGPQRIQIVYTEVVNGWLWRAVEEWTVDEMRVFYPGYDGTIADCQEVMTTRIVDHKASASYQYLLTHTPPGVPNTPVTG